MAEREGLTSLRSVQAECGLLLRRPRGFKGRYKRPMLSNPFRCSQGVLGPALKRHDPNPDERGWGHGGTGGIRTLGNISATFP
ncbi:MAG: hypothetical protein RLZ22_1050 [Verrucomicrobiota bacterium]